MKDVTAQRSDEILQELNLTYKSFFKRGSFLNYKPVVSWTNIFQDATIIGDVLLSSSIKMDFIMLKQMVNVMAHLDYLGIEDKRKLYSAGKYGVL